jgi:metallophosphoesterase superfamily enzyme
MSSDLLLLPGLIATPHRFLWCPDYAAVILSDVHLGSQAVLASQGLYVPDRHSSALHRAWEEMRLRQPALVVIAGDVFDAPTPDAGAVELCRQLLGRLPSNCRACR